MKAIVQAIYGEVDVLTFEDVERPEPGPGDVLVRVHAAGVDPGVWHVMTGRPHLIRLAGYGLRVPKARIRGDVAGRVEAVGASVTHFRKGDEVIGTCDGAFAEYACGPAAKFVPKPPNLDFEQAAAIPVSACTALQSLRDTGRVQAGQKVLIIGAAGGVGTFAVQLAKTFGAEVTGVCSTTKVDLVRSLGADVVIDYTRDDFADQETKYDLILDTAGNRSLSHLRRALAPRGRLVIIGGEGGKSWLQGLDRQLQALVISPFSRQKLGTILSIVRPADLAHLMTLAESGAIVAIIDRTYPLSQTPQAIRYLREGHARGKVVVTR